ncbi:MAG: chromosomal replication initiator protein DnaA [Coriobacteriales bacterium]|jgi:chromosomal replication initiator protein|nr:chromosomal replication initiator protein DnaA [Coriobacteriales bacterium]
MTQGEAVQLWDLALTLLEQQEGKDRPSLLAICEKLTPRSLSANEIVFSTTNEYVKGFVERNYQHELLQAIRFASGQDYQLRIVINSESEPSVPEAEPAAPLAAASVPQTTSSAGGATASSAGAAPSAAGALGSSSSVASSPVTPSASSAAPAAASMSSSTAPIPASPPLRPTVPGASPVPLAQPSSSPLVIEEKAAFEPAQPDHLTKTFETLVVGESNRFAYEAARGVAENPGRHIYNPLFLYGKSGLGKTHILLSIENYVRINHPNMKVIYTRTSDFIDDFMTMVRSQNNTDFNQKYHLVDMIILDDIQYIEGKAGTTNEIFNIFNTFVEHNKQIVLSADRSPYNLELDERHRSRFVKGGPIDIQPATFEMKLAIFENCLDYFCRDMNRPDIRELFCSDVINRVVELSSSNIRELEGIIANLVGYLLLSGKDRYERLTIEEAEQQIRKNFQFSNRQVDIPAIQRATEEYFHVSHNDILGTKRSQDISYPRQIAMYLARSLTQHSLPSIGRAFGGKDHSTVLYAVNNIEKRSMNSMKTKQEIENIREMILQ